MRKFDKDCNKVSIYEDLKEVDEETVTKENILLLTTDHTTSPQHDNVHNIGEIHNLIFIEAEITKINKTGGQLKYNSGYLFKNV